MKRVLFSSIIMMMLSAFLFAQNCNPDISITEPGVYPDQPDTAIAGESYNFVFQILALEDTMVEFSGQQLSAQIDSIKVDDVIGLPSGFSYSCEPNNCTFDHTKVGCVLLTGSPTNNQAGIYDIKIATTVYARIGISIPTKDTTDGYKLVVMSDGSASIFEPKEERIILYPNPSIDAKFVLKTAKETEVIKIIDLQGKLVDYQEISTKDDIIIDLSSTPKGVYIITVSVDNRIYTKKVVH